MDQLDRGLKSARLTRPRSVRACRCGLEGDPCAPCRAARAQWRPRPVKSPLETELMLDAFKTRPTWKG